MIRRFQLTVWPDAPAKWQNVDRYPDSDAKRRAHEALRRLVDLTPDAVHAERDTLSATARPFLRFENDAQQRFDAWRCELERRLRANQLHPAVESHLAKYRSLVPSLALILHLLENGVGTVTDIATDRAIRWATYLESHAQRLYAGVSRGPAIAAELLATKLQAGELTDGFAARDVYRNGWAGLDKAAVGDAVDMLISLNWLVERDEPTPGRVRTRHFVNSKLRFSLKPKPTKPTQAPSGSFDSSRHREKDVA